MIEQVDRDAANKYLSPAVERTVEGLHQAFAAHRIAAEARAMEKAAKIASEHASTWGKRWRKKEDEGDKPDIYQHGRLAGLSDGSATVATAIRAANQPPAQVEGISRNDLIERLHDIDQSDGLTYENAADLFYELCPGLKGNAD